MEILAKYTMLESNVKETIEKGRLSQERNSLLKALNEDKISFVNALLQNEAAVKAMLDMNVSNLAVLYCNIRSIEGRLSEIEEEVRALNHIKVCPNCGKEMKDTESYCSACGTKLPERKVEPVAEDEAHEESTKDSTDDNSVEIE